MRLQWTKDNVVSREWVKITIAAPRTPKVIAGKSYWHHQSIEPVCSEVIDFLDTQDEAWMFNPQDYLKAVQFAVERETTATMVRMLFDGQMVIEKLKLRPEQIRYRKKLAGIIDPYV